MVKEGVKACEGEPSVRSTVYRGNKKGSMLGVNLGCQKVSRGPVCYVCVFQSVFDHDSNAIMGGSCCVSGVVSVKFYGFGM